MVGLGKKQEVGILISEFVVRGKGKRIFVVIVKNMMNRFRKEMWNHFNNIHWCSATDR